MEFSGKSGPTEGCDLGARGQSDRINDIPSYQIGILITPKQVIWVTLHWHLCFC
jgi:hypothetical protein